MSEALGNFLVDLACDSNRLARFMANPQSELDTTSLTADERDAILTRDSRRVSAALGMFAQKAGLGVLTKKKKKAPAKPAKPSRPGGAKKKAPGKKR